jgi:hypothetical protein
VFPSNTVHIRNLNVPDMYGNNTMLLLVRDEEGMSYFHVFSNICFTSFPVKVTHSPDGHH